MFLQAYEGMESFITYLFSTVLNWTKEEIDVFSTKLRKQMKDPKVHSMVGFYSVYGRKPLEKTSESAVGEEVLT